MVRFRLSDVAVAVGGELVGEDVEIEGATIDSRAVSVGQLFVPIKADRDGHDFISDAASAGASASLTMRGDALQGMPGVLVEDTAGALLELGSTARERLPAPVVGVTGSVGKTSAKDLIAAASGASVPTHANPASFNNELGLPLTLLNAPADTKLTVLEMGARGPGHIAELCAVGRPTIGVVTRVALAHSEFFGSIDGVARAKGELIAALPSDGVAVLNADDPLVARMVDRTDARVVSYGSNAEPSRPDVLVDELSLDELLRPRFRLVTPDGTYPVALNARGAHMANNAAAAMATALAAGLDLDAAARGMETAEMSPSRMSVDRLSSGAVLIDDAYNANPTSVRAGLDALLALDEPNRTAVLGVMAELGDDSNQLHRDIAETCRQMSVRLIAVDAPAYGPHAEHVAAAGDVVGRLELGPGHAVLVKGSLVAGLQALARQLRDA